MTAPSRAASGQTFERAVRHLPGGTSRIHYHFDPHPIYARSAQGFRLTDVDGVERIDFLNNMTSLIHGHAHPAIKAAIIDQLDRGTAWSEPGEVEIDLAALMTSRVKTLERIRFSNSGTESVMLAIKLAREFTGRSRLAKFEGFYHGYYDYVQVSIRNTPANWGPADEPATVANSGGLSPSVLNEVVTLPFNDLAAAERLLTKHAATLACLILDPLAGQAGAPHPAPGFLDGLTAICRRLGILLIYDEVVSFRLSYGGAQAVFGGTPDLTVYGKVIGGGLPVGAVGGRADVMALLDPVGGPPRVLSGGTFSGNPLTMAAGLAAMRLLTPAEFARLDALGERLRTGGNRIFEAAGVRARWGGAGSLFRFNPTVEPVKDYRSWMRDQLPPAYFGALHGALLDRGVIIARGGIACLSTPMGEAQVDFFLGALADAVAAVAR